MQVYVVYEPKKNNQESIALVTANLEDAQKLARSIRDKFVAKGWEGWSKRVRIGAPKPIKAREIANDLVGKGNSLDMMNQGGTFSRSKDFDALGYADCFYKWANILNKFVEASI